MLESTTALVRVLVITTVGSGLEGPDLGLGHHASTPCSDSCS